MFLIVFLEKQSQYFASVFGLCGCGTRGKINVAPGEKERGSRGKLNVAPGKNDRGSKGKSADPKRVGLYFDDDIFGIPGNMDQFNTINTSASGQFLILFLVTFLS